MVSTTCPPVGTNVRLAPEDDMLVPPGWYTVSSINDNGSFHVGGNIAVWPRRIAEVEQTPAE